MDMCQTNMRGIGVYQVTKPQIMSLLHMTTKIGLLILILSLQSIFLHLTITRTGVFITDFSPFIGRMNARGLVQVITLLRLLILEVEMRVKRANHPLAVGMGMATSTPKGHRMGLMDMLTSTMIPLLRASIPTTLVTVHTMGLLTLLNTASRLRATHFLRETRLPPPILHRRPATRSTHRLIHTLPALLILFVPALLPRSPSPNRHHLNDLSRHLHEVSNPRLIFTPYLVLPETPQLPISRRRIVS